MNNDHHLLTNDYINYMGTCTIKIHYFKYFV